jgi:hypothetical protein
LKELLDIALVPVGVAIDLGPPELSATGWPLKNSTFMAVPEAAVNEDNGVPFLKDQVGPTW